MKSNSINKCTVCGLGKRERILVLFVRLFNLCFFGFVGFLFLLGSGMGFLTITKTCLYNVDPLKPHFCIVKLGFTWVYSILLIFAQNIDCGYSLEPPRRGGSNEYPQSML